jgi:hypothetical protein
MENHQMILNIFFTTIPARTFEKMTDSGRSVLFFILRGLGNGAFNIQKFGLNVCLL